MALGRTARYYKYGSTVPGKSNPGRAKKARKVKSKKDKEINSRPEQKAKRAELGRKRYKKGGIKGKDYDHAVGKFVDPKVNRGRAGEGGRKKVKNKNKGPKKK
jgi:hypothetical protein